MIKRHITRRPRKAQQQEGDKKLSEDGFRKSSVKLKTARGRKNSSQRWLQRQLNDPYVQRAQSEGMRSRAAYKLLEIQEKFHVIKPGMVVVDLGAAPGGWSQVAARLLHAGKGGQTGGCIYAIDLLEMDTLEDVLFIQGDFLDLEIKARFEAEIPHKVDVVMSDMAAVTTGHSNTDHLRTMMLAEAAFSFARAHLKVGGSFLTKVFAGGTHKELLNQLKNAFETVRHFKPPASRKESPETYVVCMGFRTD